MTDAPLPKNVYRLMQKEFNAIPGNPWVYWASSNIRNLFGNYQNMDDIAKPRQGIATSDNTRFVRYWWEVGSRLVFRDAKTSIDTKTISFKWFPYLKGAGRKKWIGGLEFVVNWNREGKEIKSFERSVIRNPEFFFRTGITYTLVGSGEFTARLNPGGAIFDVGGSCAFTNTSDLSFTILGVLNTPLTTYVLRILNPTINTQVGDIARLPIPNNISKNINSLVKKILWLNLFDETNRKESYLFLVPYHTSLDAAIITSKIAEVENQITDTVFSHYKITNDEKNRILNDLEIEDIFLKEDSFPIGGNDEIDEEGVVPQSDNVINWISYALGIVLDHFKPGKLNMLGSAIYRRDDFAIGSLPAPDESEFDELVGSPDRFAYVDPQGGRHVFSAQVEGALQSLTLPDGIAVFDEGHPRDLPTLVEKALNLMLGEQAAREVIREAAGGNSSTSLSASLRKFLEKDFFTGWHFKWYRKRPVYWPIQSGKRSYGFVLFHEKITRHTFYTIQREPYLDTKRNTVALKMADLQTSLARTTGSARKQLERELDDLRKLSDELAEFAKELEAITLSGYEPEPDWIDDGVILRMAPLWKVVPIWKSEPKKYWERLEAGDYDWSRTAMKYWPQRVRDKCKTNKSYAIAHGHEEWFLGR